VAGDIKLGHRSVRRLARRQRAAEYWLALCRDSCGLSPASGKRTKRERKAAAIARKKARKAAEKQAETERQRRAKAEERRKRREARASCGKARKTLFHRMGGGLW
jgi:membrane protein involved in colicin uptake